jgi:hypothetical protein
MLGLGVGIALGIPVGLILSSLLGQVDRWLDARWGR